MTNCLDVIEELDETSSDENESRDPKKREKDWRFELEKFRAEMYHYRQPVVMYITASELQFIGAIKYPLSHLDRSPTNLLLWRSCRFDIETLDYLKHEEPIRYKKARVGFERLYGYPAGKLLSRMRDLPEEALGSLSYRVTLKHTSWWAEHPEEQRKLLETCDWIINTCLEFPVGKIKASFRDLFNAMKKD